MKVKVSVDSVSIMEKPSRVEIPAIRRRTAGLCQEIELEELADLNGNKALDKGKHFAENQRGFASETDIAMIGNHLAMGEVKDMDAILGENVDSAVIHKTGESTKSPIFMTERMDNGGGVHQGHTCRKGEKGKKIKIKLKDNMQCQLLNDFISGIALHHDARFAICTNLIRIHGGEKDFFKITEEYYAKETYQKWKADMKYISDYFPKRCSPDFCPYFDKCEHEGTIFKTLKTERRVRVKREDYVTVDEAERCLRGNMSS